MPPVDPRALLNPKGYKKEPAKDEAPKRIDPKALLNPKSYAKQAGKDEAAKKHANFKNAIGTTLDGTTDTSDRDSPSIGQSSFIERQYNPEERAAQRPVKRVKHSLDEDDDGITEVKKSKSAAVHGSTGLTRQYREKIKDKYQDENGPPPLIPEAENVESNTNDDDEIIIVSERISPEVCLGMIEKATVRAHRVPAHKLRGFQGTSHMWPPIKVELRRLPHSKNTIINVLDAFGHDFGRIDFRVAQVLTPLMDAANSNHVRLQATLQARKRKPREVASQPTSDQYSIIIVIYAPRNQAKGICNRLEQSGIGLREPFRSDTGIEIFNPHDKNAIAPKKQFGQGSGRPAASEQKIQQRTTEQIRSDIFHIFDTMKSAAELPFMEPSPLVKTPLLPHQKQALHFMTHREVDDRQPKPAAARHYEENEDNVIDMTEDGEDENELSLWVEKFKRNGNIAWYHAITGHEIHHKPLPVLGGILADVMGLGKTADVLALIVGSLKEARDFGHEDPPEPEEDGTAFVANARGTLLIAPLSTVSNWEEQIKRHLKPKSLKYCVHHGHKRTNDPLDLAKFDVVITTYSVVAADADVRSRKRPNNPLGELNWFRIVLDEAHSIREQATRQSKTVCALAAQRRWAVTGTPVQNRLEDLGSLIKFLRIEPFDVPGNFAQYILAPFKIADVEIIPKLHVLVDSIMIRRGKEMLDLPGRNEKIVWLQMSDDETTLYKFFEKQLYTRMRTMVRDNLGFKGRNSAANTLREILRLRRLCAHGAELLSDEDLKISQGITLSTAIDLEEDSEEPDMTANQAYEHWRELWDSQLHYCESCKKSINPYTDSEVSSPEDSEEEEEEEGDEEDGEDEEGEPDPEVDDPDADYKDPNQSTNGADEVEVVKEQKTPEPDPATIEINGERPNVTFAYMTPCSHLVCPDCFEEYRDTQRSEAYPDGHVFCSTCKALVRISFFELRTGDLAENERARLEIQNNPKLAKHTRRYGGPHTKAKWLIDSLKENNKDYDPSSGERPVKSVIFSAWTSNLDLIQIALTDANINYTRLDGSMPRKLRSKALYDFEHDNTTLCILVSIGAGGLGLNLTSASRVYLMEPQYNPAAEDQAVERVHRLGQKRDVTIYKIMMQDTFEEMVLKLQDKKRKLAQATLERKEGGMFAAENAAKASLEDLKELFR